MFVAIIDEDADQVFHCDTMEELEAEIREHAESMMSEGEHMDVQFFEPTVKKRVSLEYVWTVLSDKKPAAKAGKATVEV